MRHIISILLENEAGALSRVCGLFSARGYNIESLTVAEIVDEALHACRLRANPTERSAGRLVVERSRRQELGVPRDRRDRGPEFVRRVREKLA